MRLRFLTVASLLMASGLHSSHVAAQTAPPSARMILSLGNTGFLNATDIQAATGAEVKPDLEKFQLKDFAVIVLANVAFPSLPGPVQQGLVEYVNQGGAVLITGGSQSFGSGGYEAIASILPFLLRSGNDWRATAFRLPVPLQPGHPVLAGVNFIPIGTVNDMNPRGGAMEILQSAGGGVAGPRYPLIAEAAVGAGRALGIAFDLNEFSGMRDRDLFVRNIISYLLAASRAGQAK